MLTSKCMRVQQLQGPFRLRFIVWIITLLFPVSLFAQGPDAMQKLGFAPVSDPNPAPSYGSTTMTGVSLGSDDLSGKLVLLNFWATWCPPCRLEMPSMEKLYQEFKRNGLEIVAVNFMEQEKSIQSYLKESGFTFPVLLDKNGEIAQRYGVHALPITFLIGRKGNVIAKSMGYKDWYTEKTKNFIGALLKDEGMANEPIQAKAIDEPLQANPTVATNKGDMEKRWLYSGLGVLVLALAVFFIWIRKARVSVKIDS